MTPADRADRARGGRSDGHPQDDLAAYAVDALEGRERRAVEAHLALCPACRRELAAHEEALAGMIGDERPPAEVWARISRATAGPAHGPAASPDRVVPRPEVVVVSPDGAVPLRPRRDAGRRRPGGVADRRRRRSARPPGGRLALVGAVAAALVVAAGIGVRVVDGGGDGGPPSTAVAAAELPVGRLSAADGTAVAVVGADERGSYVEMLPPMDTLPGDRTYQLWSLDGAEPVSLGLLGTGAAHRSRVVLPDGTTRVAISDEPAGGSPAPTGLVAGSGELALPA